MAKVQSVGNLVVYQRWLEPDEDPLCPWCARPLVYLRRYDVRLEAHPINLGDVESSPVPLYFDFWVAVLVWKAWRRMLEWPYLLRKRRRLARVLARWPGSLICPNCGYLEKKQLE